MCRRRFDRPAPAASFAHLDATTVLSRDIAARRSSRQSIPWTHSRISIPVIARGALFGRPPGAEVLQSYKALKTSSPSWAWTNCRKTTS